MAAAAPECCSAARRNNSVARASSRLTPWPAWYISAKLVQRLDDAMVRRIGDQARAAVEVASDAIALQQQQTQFEPREVQFLGLFRSRDPA